MPQPPRLARADRQRRATPLGELHDGLAHRAQLRAEGISFADVRSEVLAGRWRGHGRHTVQVLPELGPRWPWWLAVWESEAGAALDGACALLAQGLSGFEPVTIDVSLPRTTAGTP